MIIRTVVYEDICGNQFPVTVNGVRVNSVGELELRVAISGMKNTDTVRIRIKDGAAEFGTGNPTLDKDDISDVGSDASGNIVLKGSGG